MVLFIWGPPKPPSRPVFPADLTGEEYLDMERRWLEERFSRLVHDTTLTDEDIRKLMSPRSSEFSLSWPSTPRCSDDIDLRLLQFSEESDSDSPDQKTRSGRPELLPDFYVDESSDEGMMSAPMQVDLRTIPSVDLPITAEPPTWTCPRFQHCCHARQRHLENVAKAEELERIRQAELDAKRIWMDNCRRRREITEGPTEAPSLSSSSSSSEYEEVRLTPEEQKQLHNSWVMASVMDRGLFAACPCPVDTSHVRRRKVKK